MSKVFHADGIAPPTQLEQILCKDETKELQDRLQAQPELLAGDQIRPENPLRWLLIRREMPVNSPSTGTKEFSLDFLYVDQDGIPTFVEAKRCNDPRARREVVGQMLEYAANGRAYWTAEELVAGFLHTYKEDRESATAALQSFRGGGEEDLLSFFKSVLVNVRAGVMRLIFFLEDSSHELRSLAEFLNEQFKTIQVLVIEARQYKLPGSEQTGSTIIVPHVVGFTESVRVTKEQAQAKKTSAVSEQGEQAFWANIKSVLSPEQSEAVHDFIAKLLGIPNSRVAWLVSAVFMLEKLLPKRGLFSVTKNGQLEVYFGYWQESYPDITKPQIAIRDAFISRLVELDLLKGPPLPNAFPHLKPADWIPKANSILELLGTAAKE